MSDPEYEYRAFLLLQILDRLSQEDCKKIAFLEDLPVDSLGSEVRLTVLTQLEMRGKVSASRPDDLAKILKKIERHDLAKKVGGFAKQQKKGRTTAASKLQRLDHAAMKLSANFQVTLLQCEILLHQVENLREEAERAGHKRMEEVVAEAHSVLAERFQRKLLYSSKSIQKEQGFCREQSGESNPPSPNSQLSSLDFEAESTSPTPVPSSQLAGSVRLSHTINTSELRAAVGNLKAQSSASLPWSSRGNPTKAQSSLDFNARESSSMPLPVTCIAFPQLAGSVHLPHTVDTSEQRATVDNLKGQSVLPSRSFQHSPTIQAQLRSASAQLQQWALIPHQISVQNEDEKQPPDKIMLIWESQKPSKCNPIPCMVNTIDTTHSSTSDFDNTFHVIQNEDHRKQPPDKVMLVWNPQARRSKILKFARVTPFLEELPCKPNMVSTLSSLCTACYVSGLCLANFLASHPGPRPWS